MLIKKMTIENFRQYVGKNEIEFSTDKNKNVTLLIGDNGTGKTTLSQAFLWCLYGETPGFLKKDSILSNVVENEMYDGWNRAVKVSLEMEHAHIPYTITRTRNFTKSNGQVKSSEAGLSITCIKNGESKDLIGRDKEKCINEILPQELSAYFFLTGEKIDSMSLDIKQGKSKDFANAVNSLLDLNYYRTIIKHLKSIKKEYDSEDFSGMTSEIEKCNRQIESDNKNIETLLEKLSNIEKSISYFDEKIINLKADLKSKESSKDFETKRQDIEEKTKKKEQESQYEINAAIQDFIKKAPFFFAKTAFKKSFETLKEVSQMKTDDIPERLHADLINWIEKNHKCICGTEIAEGSKEFNFLENWRNIVPPEAIGNLVKKEKVLTLSNFKNSENLYDEFYRTHKKLDSIHDEIDEFQSQIDELTQKIAQSEDTSQIQSDLTNSEQQKKAAEESRSSWQRQICNIEFDKNENLKDRDKLLKSSETGRKIVAWKNMTEKLIEGFERQLEKEEKEKREKLISAVKEAFVKIYGTSFSVNIDENYRISTDSNLEKSTGEGMSVIYAFLAGLLSVIKNDKSRQTETNQNQDSDEKIPELESYPLVLDAPFSALDKTRISSICDVLPKVSEQVVILIKDTDGIEAKKYLNDKIGICYNLVKVGNHGDKTEIQKDENTSNLAEEN